MKHIFLSVALLAFAASLNAATIEGISPADIQIKTKDTNIPTPPNPEGTFANKSIGEITGHAVGNAVHLTIDLAAGTIRGRSAGKVIHLSIGKAASEITGRADGEVVRLNIDTTSGDIMGRAGDDRVHLHIDRAAGTIRGIAAGDRLHLDFNRADGTLMGFALGDSVHLHIGPEIQSNLEIVVAAFASCVGTTLNDGE
ncbi:MAG TPA: hypothetical protein DCZ93_10990 [Elusimicrobia bacterium]|nr:hypothetical protein [Elusimicrobiota bacterium]